MVFAMIGLVGVLALALLVAVARARKLATKITDAHTLIGKLTRDYARENIKRETLFESIESIVNERNAIMEQYHRQAAEHASAQDMMMREVKVVSMQYDSMSNAVLDAKDLEAAKKAAKRKLRRNELLSRIAEDFQEHHVKERPTRENSEKEGVDRV